MLPILTLTDLLQYDPSLFDGITLPDGADGQTLVNTIVYQYGEMQLLIPDWSALRFYTNNWFSSHLTQFNRLWDAYQVEYNPIWNKDGTVTETRTPNITRTKNDTRTPNINTSVTYDSEVETTETGDIKEQAQGFNSSTFKDVSNTVPDTTNTATRSGTDTTSQTGTDRLDSTERETGSDTTIRTEQGNIGVTTTQDMLSAEINLWKTFNFYDTIAKLYAMEFMVMIY